MTRTPRRDVTDTFAGQSVEAARRALAKRFHSAGIESAELDARMLVGTAVELDLTGLIASASRRVTATEAARIEAFAHRRVKGEPIARILGQKEFWGLALQLSAATLVPRPDTETVVEVALEALRAWPANRALRIVDIGTGSGAILLALLHELLVACDYAAALSGPCDCIVSNPPYIRSMDIAGLATEVRDHDPSAALDGGADGLDAYRALVPQAVRLLKPGGTLVVEAGRGQSGEIEGLMTAAGLTVERPPTTDLAGIPRAVSGRKIPP